MTDVLIIGGGAAGLMCARTAALRGKRVLVVERSEKIGKKILISGGGRCNFTNVDVRSENYISQNPHFCRSALARYTPQNFIAMVEQHGIAYHEKTLGQLFCDGSARAIVAMLLEECAKGRVDLALGAPIRAVMGIMNTTPFAVIAREDANVKTIKDLEGKTVGGPANDGALKLFPAFAKAAKIDPAKINLTNMTPNLREQMLKQEIGRAHV